MTFLQQYLLSVSAGRRTGVPGVVVIITDQKSADDLNRAAAEVRNAGNILVHVVLLIKNISLHFALSVHIHI